MVRPAAPYDRTMKRLTNLFPVDFVRLVLGQGACRTEPLEIAAQDRELPALSREVDFLARVQRVEGTALLLVEFQTNWVATMPARMAGYTWRLHERYHEPVYPVVVVLRPGGVLDGQWHLEAWGRTIAWCYRPARSRPMPTSPCGSSAASPTRWRWSNRCFAGGR